jgi:prepilin-type N-terminal cleavage/methylation domain-containing protein
MRSRGFTLMEVLVSVLIFSIVAIAMIGILSAAVRIYRSGESARAANEEAVAVLSQLDDDLSRMVPPGDGGFLYLRVRDQDPETDGMQPDPWKSMVLAFKIRNPDPQAAIIDIANDSGTSNARLIVCWFVGANGDLNRTTVGAAEWDGKTTSTKEITQAAAALNTSGVISKGCLYFGADLSLDQPVVEGGAGTRVDLSWSSSLPLNDDRYCTEPGSSGSYQPFPRAIRISVTLTGGSRNLIAGNVVRDNDDGIKVAGIGQIPVGPGALARIGDGTSGAVEWVRYDRAAGGVLTWQNGRPEAVRRTVRTTHDRGEPITIGTSYSLVRVLPR